MKGKIIIDKELCKGCGYCITACPEGLIVFDGSFNTMGYHTVATANIDKCNGCRLCAVVCPDIAIEVYRTGDKIEKSFNER